MRWGLLPDHNQACPHSIDQTNTMRPRSHLRQPPTRAGLHGVPPPATRFPSPGVGDSKAKRWGLLPEELRSDAGFTSTVTKESRWGLLPDRCAPGGSLRRGAGASAAELATRRGARLGTRRRTPRRTRATDAQAAHRRWGLLSQMRCAQAWASISTRPPSRAIGGPPPPSPRRRLRNVTSQRAARKDPFARASEAPAADKSRDLIHGGGETDGGEG